MTGPPSSPQLPSISNNATGHRLANNLGKRVRRRLSGAVPLDTNSSDPAVFSSDDDPSVENYAEGRRKRRWVGSWFYHQPASSDPPDECLPMPASKRTFRRQFDSGVWMGSDSTDPDDSVSEFSAPGPARLPQLEVAVAKKVPAISPAEQLAREKIHECVEEGSGMVDLGSMGLTTLSDGTIEPLSGLSHIPVVAKDVPFETKSSQIRLILAGNPLVRVPTAVFNLQHLTLLSLRGCGLERLPTAIAKLPQLEVLNIAQNSLRYLPGEFLDLLAPPNKLPSIYLQGNKFYQPGHLPLERNASPRPDYGSHDSIRAVERQQGHGQEQDDGNETDGLGSVPSLLSLSALAGGPNWLPAWIRSSDNDLRATTARYLARSPVQYSDTSNRRYSEFWLDDEQAGAVIDVEPGVSLSDACTSRPAAGKRVVNGSQASRVPSLLELAARSCQGSAELEALGDYLPDSMDNLRALLERAVKERDAGGLTCCKCKRDVIMPSTLWLEWWELARAERMKVPNGTVLERRWVSVGDGQARISPHANVAEEQVVPFLKVGCSWKCVPDDYKPGTWAAAKEVLDVRA